MKSKGVSPIHPTPRREHRRSRYGRRRFGARLRVEELESRCLLSAVPLTALEPDDTLDLALVLGDLAGAGQLAAVGTVGDGATTAADVDWFQFTLTQPATIALDARTPDGDPFVGVVSLYNDDPWSFADPDDAYGHRLLAQSVSIERTLAAGTYWVAVSGAGNVAFHPFVAGSGMPGEGGDYELSLGITGSVNEQLLVASTPGAGKAIDHSPLVVRLDFALPLDPNVFDLGATQLIYSPTGDFAGPTAQPVLLASTTYSDAATELQLVPASGLRPGYYAVLLADGSGVPALQFEVTGIEGGHVADDSTAGAHELGDFTGGAGTRVWGAIGDDPAYDYNATDPLLLNPGSDVDLYHFRLTGSGRHAFVAEVFAGRIGSRLDPGVSLFLLDPADGRLRFVEGNDNTLNDTSSTNGMVPFYTDAVLYSGLLAGDYYLAVSGGGNVPERALGMYPGEGGIFDPNTPHSGSNGWTTGGYLLNVATARDDEPPAVIDVTPVGRGFGGVSPPTLQGGTLSSPPTRFTVTFSESVNLEPLAYNAFLQTFQSLLSPVWVEAADGTRLFPRLESYDPDTYQATFLMLDGLPNGSHALHLSGPRGLTDFAGNPLIGNDASGDFVLAFTVNGPERGVGGDPLAWTNQDGNDDVLQAQELGPLFAHELQAGVTIVRDLTPTASDTSDSFRFEVLQNRTYVFVLDTTALPPGVGLSLTDAAGNAVPATVRGSGDGIQAQLAAGVYVLTVSGWGASQAATIVYQTQLALAESGDNPSPLTIGPRPASSTYLVDAAEPKAVTNLPAPVLPSSLLPFQGPSVSEGATGRSVDAAPSLTVGPLNSNSVAAMLALLIASPVSLAQGEDTASLSGDAGVNPLGASSGAPRLPTTLLAMLGAGPVGAMEEGAKPTATADVLAESAPQKQDAPVVVETRSLDLTPALNWIARLWQTLGDLELPVEEIKTDDFRPAIALANDEGRLEPVDIQAAAFGSPHDNWGWAPALLAASLALALLRVRERKTLEESGEVG